VLDKWAGAFGAEALAVRAYERDGRTVDVVEDFLSLVGIDAAAMPKAKGKGSYNPSPRKELLYFLRAFNQLNLKIDYEKFFFSVIARNKAYVRSIDLLTYEQRRAVLERYDAGNREIARRYWRNETPLFPELVPSELPETWAPGDPEYFQLASDVFAAIVKLASEGQIQRKKIQNAKAP
jgi:hypothetical protein